MIGDEIERQIWDMVRNRLNRLGERDGGWAMLYHDSSADIYWELSFPQSEMHGGGPARLAPIRSDEIPARYPSLARA